MRMRSGKLNVNTLAIELTTFFMAIFFCLLTPHKGLAEITVEENASPPARQSESVNDPDPIIVAHRGASKHAPENTISAFKLAWERGIEIKSRSEILSRLFEEIATSELKKSMSF
jgi:hypothetical protein